MRRTIVQIEFTDNGTHVGVQTRYSKYSSFEEDAELRDPGLLPKNQMLILPIGNAEIGIFTTSNSSNPLYQFNYRFATNITNDTRANAIADLGTIFYI